jgi:putative hydrolase of HD superfamily
MNMMASPDKARLMANFAYEVGTLRFVPRDFISNGIKSSANVAEHTYRVAMLAWLIANQEGADTGKTVQIALVHDLPEARTQDHGVVSSQYVSEDDARAARDQLQDVLPAGLELHQEYEHRQSLESKIVKDADRLEVALECWELKMRGFDYPEFWSVELDNYVNLFHTQTAKQLFEEAKSLHPCEWTRHFYEKKIHAMTNGQSHKLKLVTQQERA